MKLVTWNVNGIRAILRKDFTQIFTDLDADVFMIQETKTNQPLPLLLPRYREYWGCGERAGYSGTLTLVRDNLSAERLELPEILTAEGRSVGLQFPDFYLINTYFPNGGQGPARLQYKMDFYVAYLDHVRQLDRERPVLFAGDVNTAHQEIDLARPKENSTHTGFLPQERAWLDSVVGSGFTDIWREKHPREVAYSWWDYKTRARERDVGWRIDYFWGSKQLVPACADCQILGEVLGSDHAPIMLILDEEKLA